mmetsp:Transcript_935/g.2206  ORF Transcript_935/g.2206 Transcript_935/m.2206 type:complete len:440 (-) Transcript_935:41-1360(-)|eukprot:CAMPEP_0204900428 /NCGR_PEP_ID=MMETSP1397-20131031/2461_1 /ASSEMBLY_ACC=CAM_ASM_000891 /TAXON_ID=49980 /ORGANISM="Climacostomum Climacostomum virens, Strain Stock W-24" /LENGTH=439 /DNA_ID=CAMNT_0052068573 /DNA_START=66 /DNA_END=1385 /DNA_ORIENTATION=-
MVSELKTQLADALLARDPTRRSALITQVLDQVRDLVAAGTQLELEFKLTLMRLATESPFSDLQALFKGFLLDMRICLEEELQNAAPVSAFISPILLPELDHTFADAFTSLGRVSHYHRLVALFPQYFKYQLTLWETFFDTPGPLAWSWRHYVAYQASATFDCEYLMLLNKELCLQTGGHLSWFNPETLGEVPAKLKDLSTANLKLAHQPWEFSSNDVGRLLKSWAIQELVVALVIMCEFHSISSSIFGLGIEPESDLPYKISGLDHANRLFTSFAGGRLSYINYDMSNFRRPVRPSDFTWSDQGYEILEKFWPGTAEAISSCGTQAWCNTTLPPEEVKNIETEPLRRAIWKYTQRVYGLEYDDYNYQEVNLLLTLPTKRYLKKLICEPSTVTAEDFKSVGDFTNIEMVQTNVLVQEALVQTRLLYALHAVDSHSKALRS